VPGNDGSDLKAYNSFEAPKRVVPQPLEPPKAGTRMTFELPAHSLTLAYLPGEVRGTLNNPKKLGLWTQPLAAHEHPSDLRTEIVEDATNRLVFYPNRNDFDALNWPSSAGRL